MDKKLFERLKESMTQMNEIVEGSREPSRETTVTAVKSKRSETPQVFHKAGSLS